MEDSPDFFSKIEYLSVFTTFIYSYVATRFFSGWGAMINFRHTFLFSKEHLFWTVLAFAILIDVWWGSWIKGNLINQNLALYYISLLPPFVLYLISVLLFPPFRDDQKLDLHTHFNNIRRRNYLIFTGLFISFLISDYFFKRPFVLNFYFNTAAIVLSMTGYFFNKIKWLNRSILLVGWVLLLFHIAREPAIWKTQIGGFSLTEYLTIFIAFVYGSIASRILHGWGIMISKFNQIRFSGDHLAWTILIFGLLLDFWIGSWARESFISLSIGHFILTLLVPLALYSLTAVLFPTVKNGHAIDLVSFFASHKKIIYMLFAITILANAITANLLEQKLMDTENLIRIFAIGLASMAFLTKSIVVERGILLVGLLTLLLHVVMDVRGQL